MIVITAFSLDSFCVYTYISVCKRACHSAFIVCVVCMCVCVVCVCVRACVCIHVRVVPVVGGSYS